MTLRNYHAVMHATVSEAHAARIRQDVPGVWFDKKRQRLVAPGDAIQFVKLWLKQQGLVDTFTVEENPRRPNNLSRAQWAVPAAQIEALKPVWRERPHPKQHEALKFWQDRQGALIEIPTGRGKTWVGIAAACGYLPHGIRTLIITPLPAQWVAAFGRYTVPGAVKVAAITGNQGFEAVRKQPPMRYAWTPRISQERLLAELACMKPKAQARAVDQIRQGLADPKRTVPVALREWFERTATQPRPHWMILRKSDRVAVQRVDWGTVPCFPLDDDLARIATERVHRLDKPDRDSPAAARVRQRAIWAERLVNGEPLEALVDPDHDLDTITEAMTEWNAESIAARLSQADLGLPPGTDVAVVSWATLVTHAEALKRWVGRAATVILDESQEAKSRHRTKRIPQPDGKDLHVPRYNQSWAASYVTEVAPRVLLLSATPDHNSIEDLWAQYDIINPGCLGFFPACGVRYFGGVMGPHGMVYGRITNAAEFRLRAAWMHMRVEKAEMGDASPMVRIMVPLSIDELGASSLSLSEWKESAQGGTSGIMALKLNTLATQLTPWVLRRVKQAIADGERLVVLTGLVSHATLLQQRIAKLAPPTVPVALITGATPGADRLAIIAAHRAAAPAVLVATRDSIGTGTDGLQTSHRAIVVILPWNHGELIQVEGRFDRFDEDGVRIVTEVEYPIPADTVAEDIRDIILGKAERAAEAFGSQEIKRLAADLALEISAERRPGALEALAQKLLAAAEAREAAAQVRESTIAERVAAQAASRAAVDPSDTTELLDAYEVFHDDWLDE